MSELYRWDSGKETGESITVVTPGAPQAVSSPPLEGPGIDIIGDWVGLGGDTILVYNADGSPVSEFAPTDAGLDAATAKIVFPGDKIVMPENMTLTADHTLEGGVYVFPKKKVFDICLTLVEGSDVSFFQARRMRKQEQDLIGVIAPATGVAYLRSCQIYCENQLGNAYGISLTGSGSLETYDVRACGVAYSDQGGYGAYVDPACFGDLYVLGADAKFSGSTDPFNQ